MDVFGANSKTPTKIWGPTASVTVSVDALGSVVDDSWVLEGMYIGAREIVDVRQCFNDVSFIYALGNNQSSCAMTLMFAIYIGQCGDDGSESNTKHIQDGYREYVDNRISKSRDPKLIKIGNFSRMGWITGLDVGQLEPAKGICHGTAHFLVELDK